MLAQAGAVADLLSDAGFRMGLLFGALAAAGVVLAFAGRRRRQPAAGLAFGIAASVALADRFGVAAGFVVGLVALAVGGVATGRRSWVAGAAAALPGAVLVAASTDIGQPSWARLAIVVTTAAASGLVADVDRAVAPRGLAPVLLAVSVLGVYGTTPETEHAALLVGVALPIAALGWPRVIASLGPGVPVVIALVSWTAVIDGSARPGAVIGGLACLGMLVIEPAVRWGVGVTGARREWASRVATARLGLVLALHVAVVAACSRVAGLRTSAADALAISAIAYALAAAVLLAADSRRTLDTE